MERRTPPPQMIHFVVTPNDGVHIYASKFLPCTNSQGSRLKFWRINVSLEMIGEANTVSWSHSYTGQRDQLQNALGSSFKVLEQWEVLKSLESLSSRMRYDQHISENAQKSATT